MQKSVKLFIGIGIVAGIVAAGILVGWWGSRPPAPHIGPADQTRASTEPSPGNRSPMPFGTAPAVPEMATQSNSLLSGTNLAPGIGTTNLMADWEDKLDEILGSEDDDTNKVRQLFAILPRLPDEGQAEVAQHLANLVPDDGYAPLGQLLRNAKSPEPVLDVLMGDVLNRPNSVKLPLLLQLAQNPDHPKVDEAKDLIELYLDEDDPGKWPQKLQQWLKENPD